MSVMSDERFFSLQQVMMNDQGILCDLTKEQLQDFVNARVRDAVGLSSMSLSLSSTSRTLIEVNITHTIDQFLGMIECELQACGEKRHDVVVRHLKKLDQDVAKITEYATSVCLLDKSERLKK